MEKLTIILIVGLANYLMRAIPFMLFSEKELPVTLRSWLGYVPIAVLTAILAPMLFMPENKIDISLNNTMLLAAIPTFIIGKVTKNMGFTLVLGVVAMALIQNFI